MTWNTWSFKTPPVPPGGLCRGVLAPVIVRGVGEHGEWRAGATPRTCTLTGQSSPEAGTGWRGCGEQLAGVPAASPYGHLASSLWWEVSVVSLQLCSPSPLGRTSCVCGEGSTLMLPGGSTRLPGWPGVPSSWGFSQAPAWAQRCTWTLGSVGPVCVGHGHGNFWLRVSPGWGPGGTTHHAQRGGAAAFVSRHPA